MKNVNVICSFLRLNIFESVSVTFLVGYKSVEIFYYVASAVYVSTCRHNVVYHIPHCRIRASVWKTNLSKF